MDRREWLTLVYREANIFIRDNRDFIRDVTADNRDLAEEIKPLLMNQLTSILSVAENLEDFIKFSVLRDLDPDLWQREPTWERVVAGVSLECLIYDVSGIVMKIIDGELPESDPDRIQNFNPHQGIPLRDDTTQTVKQGMPGRDDRLDDHPLDHDD